MGILSQNELIASLGTVGDNSAAANPGNVRGSKYILCKYFGVPQQEMRYSIDYPYRKTLQDICYDAAVRKAASKVIEPFMDLRLEDLSGKFIVNHFRRLGVRCDAVSADFIDEISRVTFKMFVRNKRGVLKQIYSIHIKCGNHYDGPWVGVRALWNLYPISAGHLRYFIGEKYYQVPAKYLGNLDILK